MKRYGVFINLKNAKQVRWWNFVNLFVKAVGREDIIETATGKTVGVIFVITGVLAKWVTNKNLSFIKNPVEMEL